MIKEDYVSFETAKLLKEKGFDEPCYDFYDSDGIQHHCGTREPVVSDGTVSIAAPSLALTMKWLRETRGIEVIVDVCKVGEDHRTMYAWTPVAVKEDRLEYPVSQTDGSVFGGLCDGYGQAVEKGIEYCLENLV